LSQSSLSGIKVPPTPPPLQAQRQSRAKIATIKNVVNIEFDPEPERQNLEEKSGEKKKKKKKKKRRPKKRRKTQKTKSKNKKI
jgi:hypothetical protein